MAVITYDSAGTLRHFSERMRLSYPLLSDERSEVIRAFGILNENVPSDSPFFGVPFPGTYMLDANGVVKSKYFEDDYRERVTAASILVREFRTDGALRQEITAKYLKLTAWAANDLVYPGSRVMLMLDLELPERMHVYAPGVQGYIPIQWKAGESKSWMAGPVAFPPSRMLRLPAINETVPVYEGKIRLTRELTIGQEKELAPALSPDRELMIPQSFVYQACDDKVCYTPETIPLQWKFKVSKFDSQRAPAEVRGKSKPGGK